MSEPLSGAEKRRQDLAYAIGRLDPKTGHVYIDGNDACLAVADTVLDHLADRAPDVAASEIYTPEGVQAALAHAWDEGAQAATDWIESGAWLGAMPDNPYRADALTAEEGETDG